MRHVTVYITDNEFSHFLALTRSLSYVKKIETDEDSKDIILNNINEGLKEVELYKRGKLKTTRANDFLNEV